MPLDIEPSERAIQPNEVIRFKLNFNTNESVSINEPSTGKIVIHDSTEIPTVRRGNSYLRAGRYYVVYIQEQISKLLKSPYKSRCYNYTDENLISYQKADPKNLPHIFFDKPLSTEDCIIGCLGQKTFHKCGCWPPEIPFLFHTGQPKEGISEAKMCNWNQLGLNASKYNGYNVSTCVYRKFYECFGMFEKGCRNDCPEDCL